MVQYQKSRSCLSLAGLRWVDIILGPAAVLTFRAGFWAASFVYLILQWRSGKLGGPRDPPFRPPQGHVDVEEGEE